MNDAAKERLHKAERAIQSAINVLEDGDLDFAASRAYYAMFYVVEALLEEKGLKFSKHGGVHGAFAQHFVKTGAFDAKYHHWLVSSFNQRALGDYGLVPEFSEKDVQETIEQARDFLNTAKNYLKGE